MHHRIPASLDRLSSRSVKVVALLALMLAPLPARGQSCPPPGGNGGNGGTGGSLPTLLTITLDGNKSDWASVTANPLQTTTDGEMRSPCTLSTPLDLDCTIGGYRNITGRDLGKFAWTFDANNIYLYLDRFGSSNNTQTFYFYADSGSNQRMNTGEKVLQVVYSGSNGKLTSELFDYNAVGGAFGDATGDYMAHPTTTFADGYRIGGTLSGGTVIDADQFWAWADGRGFEARIPWASLGVPSATAVYFHVSSSNSSNEAQVPDQLDDNLGGPNGKIGVFGFLRVGFAPNRSSSVGTGTAFVDYAHTVTNTGTLPDVYDFVATSSLGWRVELYDARFASPGTFMGADVNGDGTWDSIGAGYDANGNNRPQTPITMTAGATFPVTVRMFPPVGFSGIQDVTIVSAVSTASPTCLYASVVDTTAVGELDLFPSPQSKSAVPGAAVDYTLTLLNFTLADIFDFQVLSSAGFRVDLYTDLLAHVATDLTGNGTWDSIDPGFDTNTNTKPDFGTTANGGSRTFVVRITTAGPVGTVDTTTVQALGDANGAFATATLTTTLRNRLTLTPSYQTSNGTNLYSGPDASVFFAHTLINAWGAADSVTLSATSTYPFRFWTDPNGDGNPNDGALITAPISLGAFGGTQRLVVEVIVPAGVPIGTISTTNVTATGSVDPPVGTATAIDQVRISRVASYGDVLHTVARTFFARCDTLYAQATGLVPGTTNQYTIVYLDPSLVTVRSQVVPTDGNGVAVDQYTFPSNAPLGTWTLRLLDGGTPIDSITIGLDPTGASSTIAPVVQSQSSYAVSADTFSAVATFNNANTGASYFDTTYQYLVLNPGGTQYLRTDGTFAAYTGSELTRSTSPHTVPAQGSDSETFSVSNITFPGAGVYQLVITWRASCGTVIATTTVPVLVGTTLASFQDAGGAIPQELFGPGSTVFLRGATYAPSTGYQVVYYRPDGNLASALNQSVTSSPTGALATSITTAALGSDGLWTAVSYPVGVLPPSTYAPTDPSILAVDTFTVEVDADDDGIPDDVDIDDDNDGILDTVEGSGTVDTDGDGVPDQLDRDSDNDGINDLVESGIALGQIATLDPNGDGRIDTAVGTNGFADSLETAPDSGAPIYFLANTDGSGPADFRDLDTDNDGINDVVEGGETDANGDGMIDGLPNGTTGQVPGADNVVPDSDATAPPDWRDLDSDGDGTSDIDESGQGYLDGDNDGDIDVTTDTDGDGIPDVADGLPNQFGDAFDHDNDGIPDLIDIDDDNDGILDTVEGNGTVDTDGDGVFDSFDRDSDNDGINDLVESGIPLGQIATLDTNGDGRIDAPVGVNGLADAVETAPDSGTPNYALANTDGSGPPDFRDLDTDNDGINDAIEGGGVDADGNGMIDGTPDGAGQIPGADNAVPDTDGTAPPDFRDLDSDGDGIPDITESGQGYLDGDADGDIDNTLDTDGDGIPNVADGLPNQFGDAADHDNDGIPDAIDIDDDNDGILDTVEGNGAVDTDGDGVPDSFDRDSDNDGINDLVESGIPLGQIAALDPNGDGRIDAPVGTNGFADSLEVGPDSGLPNYAIANTDGSGPPDFRDLDTDNDGINDAVEGGGVDANGDGMIDGTPDGAGQIPGADNAVPDTDGTAPPDFRDLDSDGDGIPDITESGQGYLDGDSDGDIDVTTDTDGDGIPDIADGMPNQFGDAFDHDNDGIPDAIDIDDDNDGILDTVEGNGTVDTDGDGVPDSFDRDSDNDGINDLVESGIPLGQIAALDTNGDGRIDTPVGANGFANSLETAPDSGVPNYSVANTDGTGPADYRDLDTDNDGINDAIEGGGVDADGNGMIDGTPDGAGQIPGADNGVPDTDGTAPPDFRDVDSDGDGIPDIVESGQGYLDGDNDGDIDDTTDADNDGIPNVADGLPNQFGDAADHDNDGIPDGVDIDDDNDGILDTVEGNGTVDTDGDGVPDSFDRDSDNDGINDLVESGIPLAQIPSLDPDGDGRIDTNVGTNGLANAVETSPDSGTPNYALANTDGSGPPDFRDLDTDNDGINDVIEGGGVDLDGNGQLDGTPNGAGQSSGADNAVPDTDGSAPPDFRDVDSDGDGIPDIDESGQGYLDGDNDGDIDDATDTDGDGIPDVTDGLPNQFGDAFDHDNDGIPDAIDIDDDNDGILDTVEGNGTVDTDFDGVPDSFDRDSDNDGINDLVESGIPLGQIAALDTNGDGRIDVAVGANGFADTLELGTDSGVPNYALANTDGNGPPDFRDLDTDNDGINDSIEGGGVDADGNGLIDGVVDGSGQISGSDNSVPNSDGTGAPDFRDLDSNDDGILDIDETGEGALDADDDGDIDDPTDIDGDGIPTVADGLPDDFGDDPTAFPYLLRNDQLVNLTTPLSTIFSKTYPLPLGEPSLDQLGPNLVPEEGEGALRSAPGSSDDDDFYIGTVIPAVDDPDATVLGDAGRPLVFYELADPTKTIFLSKVGGKVRIVWAP